MDEAGAQLSPYCSGCHCLPAPPVPPTTPVLAPSHCGSDAVCQVNLFSSSFAVPASVPGNCKQLTPAAEPLMGLGPSSCTPDGDEGRAMLPAT